MDTHKDVCNYYTLHGREYNYVNTILETILREIMWNCLKFIKEETLLQTNACNMGEHKDHIFFVHTPKCHPKLSGEGIGYSWGCVNNY